ncbi:MAG: hypothetical protein AAFV53_17560 [Myxococcota bacterium]
MKAVYFAPLIICLTGCTSLFEGVLDSEPRSLDSGGWRVGGETISPKRVALRGSLHEFKANTDQGWGEGISWDAAGFAIDVRGSGQGIMMSMVTIENLALEDLEAGQRLTNEADWIPFGEPRIHAIGCAGEVEDEWAYDYSAEELTLDVTDVTDEDVTIHVQGIFGITRRGYVDTTVTLPLD